MTQTTALPHREDGTYPAGAGFLPAYVMDDIRALALTGALPLAASFRHLITIGAAVEYAPARLALTAHGAEIAYHRLDAERGTYEPLHVGWVTNAEARAAGLPSYRPPVVRWWDGQQITDWRHP